jgi:hypothetical protein
MRLRSDVREERLVIRFVRLFAVPGMNHCADGPSTDQFEDADSFACR